VKVVHVITGLHVGGAETMLHKLLLAMDRERFDPVVVSLLAGGEILDQMEKSGIPVHVLRMKRGMISPAAVMRLRRLARVLSPDVIQGWMYHGNLAASLMSLFAPGHPQLFWNIRHSMYDLKHERRMTRLAIRLGAALSSQPRRILFNSTVSINQHADLGFCRERAQMVPNGFDLTRFQPASEARRALRLELGLDPGTPLVGVVGRRHPLKGHDDFLRTAEEVHRRRPDVHFVLAGRGVTTEDPVFVDFLQGRDDADHWHFLGPRTDTPILFAALDVLAMPSVSEGFPNVVGEAMACGVPCAATDVGETATLVADLGKVVPAGDPNSLAKAILELLSLDSTSRRALGVECRDRIRREYSLDKVAGIYGDLYASS